MTRKKEKEEELEKPTGDIYEDEQREEQLEEDEISPAEAGFVEGYESPKMLRCGKCGKKFDLENSIERAFEGETYWFCSEECEKKFEKKFKK